MAKRIRYSVRTTVSRQSNSKIRVKRTVNNNGRVRTVTKTY